jgi:di/tricarboxylate transporter
VAIVWRSGCRSTRELTQSTINCTLHAPQTNLMVYGEGNYKFVDFVKVGLPLTFVLAITASFATFFLIE